MPARYGRASPPIPAPTISIVTPSFEQGRFLERTLSSVLAQGYPSLEYVVQDGGSTDETAAILRRYGDRLSGWVSEADGGQADAINRAFERTSGELMAYLNADDVLLPGALAYVAAYIESHPRVDVVYGHRLLIDEDDMEIGRWIVPRHSTRALRLGDYVPQETLFWRRRIWDASGGFVDCRFSYALDWDLLLRFQRAGARIRRLPRLLGAFRVHAGQKSTAQASEGIEECRLLRRRVHGRDLSDREVLARLAPYLLRHRLAHALHELREALPAQQIRVATTWDEIATSSSDCSQAL